MGVETDRCKSPGKWNPDLDRKCGDGAFFEGEIEIEGGGGGDVAGAPLSASLSLSLIEELEGAYLSALRSAKGAPPLLGDVS